MVRFVTLPTHNKIQYRFIFTRVLITNMKLWGGEITLIFLPLLLCVLEYIEESTAHILECTSLLFSTRGLDRLRLQPFLRLSKDIISPCLLFPILTSVSLNFKILFYFSFINSFSPERDFLSSKQQQLKIHWCMLNELIKGKQNQIQLGD